MQAKLGFGAARTLQASKACRRGEINQFRDIQSAWRLRCARSVSTQAEKHGDKNVESRGTVYRCHLITVEVAARIDMV